jgi:hypothetical protein
MVNRQTTERDMDSKTDTYSELFETDDGYELIVWASAEDAEDDNGSKAIDRYPACKCCVDDMGYLGAEVGKATIAAVWVDEDGTSDEVVDHICQDCYDAQRHRYCRLEDWENMREAAWQAETDRMILAHTRR